MYLMLKFGKEICYHQEEGCRGVQSHKTKHFNPI